MSVSARRLRKFCFYGLLLGVGLSCALLLTSDLTGQKLWNDGGFGRISRIFWPAVSIFGMLDVDVGRSVILALFAIAIGANGLLYAILGFVAFFVDRLVDRIAESISSARNPLKRV
jgi:hypothetical protein